MLLKTRGCLAISFLLCVTAASARAQSIRGIITDSATSRPIAGVRVVLIRPPNTQLAAAMTDSTGAYVVASSAVERVQLVVQRVGYNSLLSEPIALTLGESVRLDLTLSPAPIPLEPVVATATPVQSWNLDRFMERLRTGGGRYLGPQQIAELAPRTAIQAVLRTGAGQFLADERGNGLLMRGDRNVYCVPRVFIDGSEQLTPDESRMSGRRRDLTGFNVEGLIPVSSIRGVEVYSRLSDAPVEYRTRLKSLCGIVLFWTDRAFGVR